MKKCFWLFAAVGLLAVLAAVPGYAWQGRMAGMGDVYGLVEDESDFLTHPAGIAAGKGVNQYLDMRTTYKETTKWDFDFSEASNTGANAFSYSADGEEWRGEGLIGIAIPVGLCRAGIFFNYTGNLFKRGKYDGNGMYAYTSLSSNAVDSSVFDLRDDHDNYALRFLYGMPVTPDFRLGGELEIAYRDEKLTETQAFYPGLIYQNHLQSTLYPEMNLLPYGIPYDSQYYEAQVKLSGEGMIGPAKLSFTVKAGRPFGGDNKYEYLGSFLTSGEAAIMDGDVEGWNAGFDFWARIPLDTNLVMPIVVSMGHKQIEKDGSGPATWRIPSLYEYEHNVKTNYVSAGLGLDFTPCKGSKIAGGLYYDYLRTRQNVYQTAFETGIRTFNDAYDLSDYPDATEHRITLKTVAEKEISSRVAIRGGFNIFYGWVYNDYTTTTFYDPDLFSSELAENGSRFGIGASLGLTIKFGKVSFEPFFNGGYQHLKVDGDGSDMYQITDSFLTSSDNEKTSWFIGGGFSVRF